MYNSILFTHDDLDGAGCRIIYRLFHLNDPDNTWAAFTCSIFSLDNCVNNVLRSNNITADTELIFADICPSNETLAMLKSNYKDVKIFDHHDTNSRAKMYFPDAIITERNSMGVMECGTSLLHQYLTAVTMQRNHTGEYIPNYKLGEEFVETVRSYDTYEWKVTNNKRAQEMNILFYMLGMDVYCRLFQNRLVDTNSTELISDEELMFINCKLDLDQRIIDSFDLRDVLPVESNGRCLALCTNTKGVGISELAHQFLLKHPEFDGVASFTFAKGGKWELRAVKDDVNLATEFATKMGGGGHPKAAGAPLNENAKKQIIDILTNELQVK